MNNKILPAVIFAALVVATRRSAQAQNNASSVPTQQQFQIIDIVNELPKHPTKVFPTRQLWQIDTVVFHHTLTTTGTPTGIAYYHIEDNDWPGIAYTFYVRKSGKIYMVNDLTTICYHDSGRNTRSLGICFEGNFDVDVMPDVQMYAGAALFRYIETILDKNLFLDYHKNDSGKTCPGLNFPYAQFENVVQQYA